MHFGKESNELQSGIFLAERRCLTDTELTPKHTDVSCSRKRKGCSTLPMTSLPHRRLPRRKQFSHRQTDCTHRDSTGFDAMNGSICRTAMLHRYAEANAQAVEIGKRNADVHGTHADRPAMGCRGILTCKTTPRMQGAVILMTIYLLTTLSLPSEAMTLSLPSEAAILSLPSEASILSLPSEATTLSLPSEATTLSLSSEATILSLPVKAAG